VTIRVGHLSPEYLNIYADRGNIAVLSRRAAWRGHELEVQAIGMGDPVVLGAHDLLYVGGGDREQALVSLDIAGRARRFDAVRAARRCSGLRRLPAWRFTATGRVPSCPVRGAAPAVAGDR
jgi:CobQ-like glutamine amidotransferase family enzyme